MHLETRVPTKDMPERPQTIFTKFTALDLKHKLEAQENLSQLRTIDIHDIAI